MVQLARRLRQILRLHAIEESPWEPRLAAVDAAERADPKRGHALFLDLKLEILRFRFSQLASRLRAHAWLADPPTLEDWMDERDLGKAIARLARDVRHADALAEALAEARAAAAALAARRVVLDLAPFARVAYEDLARAAERAEAVRRTVAREARNDARYAAARARAERLVDARASVPDLSASAVPDPDAAAARLEEVERDLADAEKAEAALARVAAALRDPSVREEEREGRARLLAEARTAAAARDHAALARLAHDAERVRAEAAKRTGEAARARRKGLRVEGRRGKDDLQDMFG